MPMLSTRKASANRRNTGIGSLEMTSIATTPMTANTAWRLNRVKAES